MPDPNLIFYDTQTETGFTSAGVSAFSELNPAAVVRELIQNSLDAALIEAKENCAKVQFRLFESQTKDIPGIKSYKAAFKSAKHHQMVDGRLPIAAGPIAERVENALRKKNQRILAVSDNGCGLDKAKMLALLGDGISAKSANSAGTYGNGHSVPIPASDLRYLLYGGLTENGKTIASGKALLATHIKNNKLLSDRGLFVVDGVIDTQLRGLSYSFPSEDLIPELIRNEIDLIKNTFGHGTVILVPSFNQFGEDNESLWKIVSKATVCSFFEAIHSEKLIIEVKDDIIGSSNCLNKQNLKEILEEYKNEKRSTGAYISGSKANLAYETLVESKINKLETTLGNVDILLNDKKVERTSIGLCRNGMWITDVIPTFRGKFSDLYPFRALLLLHSEERNSLYKIIQEIETPLHNKLELKLISNDEKKKKLKNALDEISDWFRNNVTKLDSNSYSPDSVLCLRFVDGTHSGGGIDNDFMGPPSVVEPFSPGSGTDEAEGSSEKGEQPSGGKGNGQGDRSQKKRRKIKNPNNFRIVARSNGSEKLKILLDCNEDCENAELSVFIDENIDETCDNFSNNELVKLFDATIDSKKISQKKLDKTSRIKLGKLKANTQTVIETKFRLPNFVLCKTLNFTPSFKIEIEQIVEEQTSEGKAKR
ncbi:MAG: hypothetical protein OXC02_00130 [Rhodobacteraceae bacterium]|nr:hypothetical protein [Paracoccaceae bacterium]